MGEFKRKSDGWRIFTTEHQRATVERIKSGATPLGVWAALGLPWGAPEVESLTWIHLPYRKHGARGEGRTRDLLITNSVERRILRAFGDCAQFDTTENTETVYRSVYG